ncbi:MAG: zinc ABC transporter substrate-binding protein [Coprobacter sp.]|nr:zinc ABC transporter substrate-binding protein [Coprobacter sp.]
MYRYITRFLIIWAVVLSSCSYHVPSRPVVAVTIPPVESWVEALVGDRMEVICAVPAGGNPESYDLPPSAMAQLSNCNLYFSCGYLGFERAWLPRLEANNPQMQLVNLADNIELIYGTHHHHHDGETCTHHHDEGAPDPHIWCSPRRARTMVRSIYETLCRADSAGVAEYRARYDSLDTRLARLDSLLMQRLAPCKGRAFTVYHPTLTYLAADYGLIQLSLEPDGKSPSPQHFRHMVDEARHHGVKVVFIQREFDPRQAETFAREVGCRTQVIDPLSHDWETEINRIADAITAE